MDRNRLDEKGLCEFCDGKALFELEFDDDSTANACELCAKMDDFTDIVTRTDQRLYRDVRADPLAWELLQAKQRHEQAGSFKILHDYGDPRTWASYARAGSES